MKKYWLTLSALCLCLLLTIPALADKTPQEAVSEMTWGVNLGTLYMTGDYDSAAVNWDSTATKTLGYVSNAPMGIGVTFKNSSFDWLCYHQLHENTFDASLTLPYGVSNDGDVWFDGLFEISVFLDKNAGSEASIRLSNTRLVLSNGSVEYLSQLDKVYELNSFGDYYNGLRSCPLNVASQLNLTPSSRYDGAQLKTTVTQISIPFSETGKVDCLFQFGREKIDQYEITDAYIDQGVNTFRLPVSWTAFTNDTTFEIDRAWLDAVKTEVDYILGKGCYCILNMHEDYLQESFVGDHWESDWTQDQYKDYVTRRFNAIWQQIADYFKGYPDTLIFEAANEPVSGNMSEWYNNNETYRQSQINMVNEMSQSFVNTIRNSGGANENRLLMLATPGFNRPDGLNTLDIPEDDNLIMTVHSYMEIENTWRGKAGDPDYQYEQPTDEYFATLADFMDRTGIPVIIGETGVSHKETDAERAERAGYFYRKCKEAGIPALWWDDYFVTDDGFYYWLYNIAEEQFGDISIVQAIQEAMNISVGSALNAPTISTNSATAYAGQEFAVLISGVDAEAQTTAAYVVAADNRTRMGDYTLTERDGQLGIWINVDDYPLGEYKLTVISSAEGRTPGYASLRFTVTETPPADFLLTVAKTELVTWENTEVYFAAAGADRLTVRVQMLEDSSQDHELTWEGQEHTWTWNYGGVGTYLFTPVAYFGEEEVTDENAQVTVTIHANGSLGAFQICDIPSVIPLGSGIDASFTPSEGAENYTIHLHYCPDEWYFQGEIYTTSDQQNYNYFHYDAETLNAPGRYRIAIYANAYGMEYAETHKYFYVSEEPLENNISISINGENGNVTIPAQTFIPVQISAPGATAIRLINPDGYWNCWAGSELDENGIYTYIDIADAGTYYYMAQACYDQGYDWNELDPYSFDWDNEPLHWTGISNEMTVTVIAEGTSSGSVFHHEESVVRGEPIHVTLDDVGDAQQITVYLTTPEGYWHNIVFDRNEEQHTTPISFAFPSADLWEGTWGINVITSKPGFNSVTTSHNIEITSPAENQFVVEVQEEIFDQTDFFISAYEPNATGLTLYVRHAENGAVLHEWPFGGNSMSVTNCQVEAGDWEITVVAHYQDENGNQLREDRVSEVFYRTANYVGETEEPVIHLPSVIAPGVQLSFTVDGLEQAASSPSYWEISVRNQDHLDDQGNWTDVAFWNIDTDPVLPDFFTIPGDQLEEGCHYVVRVWIDPSGCPGVSKESTFEVRSDGAEMVLPASLVVIEEEAFAGIGASTVHVPSGVQTISARAFADCEHLVAVYLPASVTNIADDAFETFVTIYAPAGSPAEAFANRIGLSFVAVDRDTCFQPRVTSD